ncbi:hypothetical protein K1T71_008133 [Dendrolimus kikuchii]|uniref:Uncharacterized protein n=1 Tax=Dendrolimus kikuchii TaxID=765133 RepID=A0ACC1CWT6_9NEOP|nr:hypothetical protein K1T71_008133 [Dendrolimus kikuchii]
MESEAKSMNGDEVVISGISGIFPQSNSVLEFGENLYSKVDMVIVNHSFENSKIPELPIHMGKISDLEKFDAQFFRVSYWQVIDIDPLCRKLMEHTFNAIFDAGVNPVTLAGKRIGVYAGSSFNDHFAKMMDDFNSKNLSVPVGASSAMLAHRISYWLDSKCPSYTVDFSCVSSSLCLEKAVNDIKLGFIDAAIVGGTNACNNPILNYNLRKAGLLCLDGKTRCFDKKGDGYVRSEAVTSLFLQRAKDAKRIYAEICHVKGGYLMRQDAEFLPKREVEDLINFIQTFYKEVKVSPKDVEYVEANGSGIVSADKNELDAIDRVFKSNGSLKIGSVKSNIGHTEAASGICSVIKMCLAYRSGIIPSNLHYSEPIDNDAIFNNRLKVVVENTLFDRGYTAINNFSFTGGNFHILLKGHYKPKAIVLYCTNENMHVDIIF